MSAIGLLPVRALVTMVGAVIVPRPARSRLMFPTLLAALLLTGAAGCGSSPPAELTDRLWVHEMPTSPRDTVDAFVLTKVGKRSAGTFYRGSAYRGTHDSFTWSGRGKDRGRLHLLQDQRDYEVRMKPCKPDRGFDHCMLLEGDPKQVVRYQSRKRWAIPRRGRGHEALDVPGLIVELSDDDPELEALVEATWD